jgi:hypothetical protein
MAEEELAKIGEISDHFNTFENITNQISDEVNLTDFTDELKDIYGENATIEGDIIKVNGRTIDFKELSEKWKDGNTKSILEFYGLDLGQLESDSKLSEAFKSLDEKFKIKDKLNKIEDDIKGLQEKFDLDSVNSGEDLEKKINENPELKEKVDKLDKKVKELEKENKTKKSSYSNIIQKLKIAGVALTAYEIYQAAKEYQKDYNGCWLVSDDGSELLQDEEQNVGDCKLSAFTCGDVNKTYKSCSTDGTEYLDTKNKNSELCDGSSNNCSSLCDMEKLLPLLKDKTNPHKGKHVKCKHISIGKAIADVINTGANNLIDELMKYLKYFIFVMVGIIAVLIIIKIFGMVFKGKKE